MRSCRDASRSPGTGRPRGAALALAVSALFVTCMWPAAAPAAASDADLVASVDAVRMSQTISTLQGLGSREFHLESSRQAAEFLLDSFEGLGVQAEHQYFMVGEAQVSNVVATVPGADEGGAMFLFGAHYDSENFAVHDLSAAENTSAPGADDDASGVAVVLELARLLGGAGLPWTLRFVMFGAEEYGYDDSGGCKGSEHFVQEEVAQGRVYAGTAIMDMVGFRAGEANRAVLVLNSDHDDLASSVTEAVDAFGINLALETREDPAITYSDHGSFWAQGIPSMLVIEELNDRDFPVNPYYHTSGDTLDTLAMDQVEAVAKALLGGLVLIDEGGGDGTLLVFGTVIMSALIVSIASYVHFRRRRGRVAR